MKNALTYLILVGAILLLSFSQQQCEGNSVGSVEQVNGLYVFYRSKPCKTYEDLGTVKPGITLTTKGSELIDALIEKAKKKYPTGDAIVISDPDMNSASVIKFTP